MTRSAAAAYVENWVKVLEKDPHEIHRAARDAQKMTDHLMERAIKPRGCQAERGKNRGAQLTQEYSHARGPQIDQPLRSAGDRYAWSAIERHAPKQSPEQSPQKQPAQAQQHDRGPSR